MSQRARKRRLFNFVGTPNCSRGCAAYEMHAGRRTAWIKGVWTYL